MLIHAATGGVGLVAVQYAQRLGAEAGHRGGVFWWFFGVDRISGDHGHWFPYEFGMIIWGPWDECHPM